MTKDMKYKILTYADFTELPDCLSGCTTKDKERKSLNGLQCIVHCNESCNKTSCIDCYTGDYLTQEEAIALMATVAWSTAIGDDE